MTEKNNLEKHEKFIDPICGMTVFAETSAGKIEHDGKTIYFCSKNCLEKFKKQISKTAEQNSFVQIGREQTSLEDLAQTIESHIDPICGMTVNAETAAGKIEYDGEVFYFCCQNCLKRFQAKIDGFPDSGFVGISGLKKNAEKEKTKETITDPVCSMTVEPEIAAGNLIFKMTTYYFCAVGCLNKFRQNPEKFLKSEPCARIDDAMNPKEVEYTCPMHPEIVQIGPGICPKCGMALEPKTFSLDDAPDPGIC